MLLFRGRVSMTIRANERCNESLLVHSIWSFRRDFFLDRAIYAFASCGGPVAALKVI